jgi:hypothetical protein
VSFATITPYVASQWVFIVAVVYFDMNSVRKLLDNPRMHRVYPFLNFMLPPIQPPSLKFGFMTYDRSLIYIYDLEEQPVIPAFKPTLTSNGSIKNETLIIES